jgi:hypothetical protein
LAKKKTPPRQKGTGSGGSAAPSPRGGGAPGAGATLSGRPLIGGQPKAQTPPPKQPTDTEFRQAVSVAAGRLPGLADPKTDAVYLAPADLTGYADLHAAATTALQAIAAKNVVTAADRTQAAQTIKDLEDAAAALVKRASAAKAESDGFRKEITDAAADLAKRLAALTEKAIYLDADDLPSFQTAYNTGTTAANTVATKPRVSATDHADASQRLAKLKLDVVTLQGKADLTETESNNFRTEIEERAKLLEGLLTPRQMAYLPEAVADAFRKQREECADVLSDAAALTRVTTEAHTGALTSFDELDAQAQTLATQAETIRVALEARMATETTAFNRAKAEAKSFGVDIDGLNKLNKRMRDAADAKKWGEVADHLDGMRDESAKILSYTEALGNSVDRIMKLPNSVDKVKHGPRSSSRSAQP